MIAIQETKQNIVDAINNSGLHASLVEMIMKELYIEVKQQADAVYQQELAHYQAALAVQEKEVKEAEE